MQRQERMHSFGGKQVFVENPLNWFTLPEIGESSREQH